MTADRGKASITEMLAELADLGFAWRDIARLVGVTVAAVQKWRRGEGATGESRRRVASLLAACDLIAEHYEVREIASWFEMPLVGEAPVTPIDLYVEERVDLVFDYASGHADPEQILSDFDPRWRERYRSDFEVFRAADGQLSIRPKAE
jgi:transcriptional regulator with XRE-family HTH domain